MIERKGDLIKNLRLAILAQGINVIFSFTVSLILPKVLGVEQYSYWQLFVFYITYAGLFHLGLSDGIYLRYGGEYIGNLNSSLIGTQMKIMTLWQTIILLIALVLFSNSIVYDANRRKVWIFFLVYVIVANATWYLGYVFQACNLTRIFSVSVIVLNISFVIFLLILICFNQKSFEIYCIFYIIAMLFSFLYIASKGKEFIFSKISPFNITIKAISENIKTGINLTVANIASSLILGVGRIVVDKTSGINSFGLISLALSLTNFFLQFVLQISMVLFPALRRLKENKIKSTFIQLQNNIGYILAIVMVGYIPVKIILRIWLPSYEKSFYYMIFLLPICLFDGKMQLIYSTFLKVLRKERVLFYINAIALAMSFVLCLTAVFYSNNIAYIALAMMLAVFFRYIIAYIYLNRKLKIAFNFNFIYETVFVIIFILSNVMLNDLIAFALVLVFYFVYLIINKNNIKQMVIGARTRLNI